MDIRKLFKANKKAVKAEVEEIKNLQISDEDKKAAKVAAQLAVSALAAYGIPAGVAQEPLEKVLQYVIRDARDGIKDPNKLFIKRVIKELKAE